MNRNMSQQRQLQTRVLNPKKLRKETSSDRRGQTLLLPQQMMGNYPTCQLEGRMQDQVQVAVDRKVLGKE